MSVPSAPALLDTAVPMYAAGTPHAYRDACQWVMTEIASGRLQVVIDAELIQEILHRYGAQGRYADAVAHPPFRLRQLLAGQRQLSFRNQGPDAAQGFSCLLGNFRL